MKKQVLFLLISILFASGLMAQEKPIITMNCYIRTNDSMTLGIGFHKPATLLLVANGDTIHIKSSPRLEFGVTRMSVNNGPLEIYGDASSIKNLEIEMTKVSTVLDSIDITACTELESLNLAGNNRLKMIDLTHNTKLSGLNLESCDLHEVNIAHLSQLKHLNLSSNKLSTIDFPNNSLTKVFIHDNALTEIDVRKFSDNLTDLSLSYNQLQELDLSRFSLLSFLNCSHNQIHTLVLPTNVDSLDLLYVYNNKLSTLDISQASNLSWVEAQHNELRELKLPEAPNLRFLNISHNQLMGNLILPKYPLLTRLLCNNNQLTSIDASLSPKLEKFDFEDNNISDDKRPLLASQVSWDNLNSDYMQRVTYEAKRARYKEFVSLLESNGPSEYKSPSDAELSLALDVGYMMTVSKYATNQGYVGGVLGFSNHKKYPYHGKSIHQFWVGGGIYYGRYNLHKTEAIPTFTVAYSPMFLYFRTAVTKYNVNPSVGLNLANIGQVHAGYTYGYRRINGVKINGLTLSVSINIGINHMFDLSN